MFLESERSDRRRVSAFVGHLAVSYTPVPWKGRRRGDAIKGRDWKSVLIDNYQLTINGNGTGFLACHDHTQQHDDQDDDERRYTGGQHYTHVEVKFFRRSGRRFVSAQNVVNCGFCFGGEKIDRLEFVWQSFWLGNKRVNQRSLTSENGESAERVLSLSRSGIVHGRDGQIVGRRRF